VLHGAAQAAPEAIDAFAAEFRHRLEGYAGLAAAAHLERARGA
jgi:glutathione-regulated potassium-efflux system ancillary protein KefF